MITSPIVSPSWGTSLHLAVDDTDEIGGDVRLTLARKELRTLLEWKLRHVLCSGQTVVGPYVSVRP